MLNILVLKKNYDFANKYQSQKNYFVMAKHQRTNRLMNYYMVRKLLRTTLFIFSMLLVSQVVMSNDTNPEPRIVIFPNPAGAYFSYSVDSEDSIQRITIFNIIGAKVKEVIKPMPGEHISVGDLQRGTYLLEIVGESGNIITVQRLRKM